MSKKKIQTATDSPPPDSVKVKVAAPPAPKPKEERQLPKLDPNQNVQFRLEVALCWKQVLNSNPTPPSGNEAAEYVNREIRGFAELQMKKLLGMVPSGVQSISGPSPQAQEERRVEVMAAPAGSLAKRYKASGEFDVDGRPIMMDVTEVPRSSYTQPFPDNMGMTVATEVSSRRDLSAGMMTSDNGNRIGIGGQFYEAVMRTIR